MEACRWRHVQELVFIETVHTRTHHHVNTPISTHQQSTHKYLEPPVHQPLVEQLPKYPPYTLHKAHIECLVIILKVNPPSQSCDCLFPFLAVPHDDAATLFVVIGNAHLHDIITRLDVWARWNEVGDDDVEHHQDKVECIQEFPLLPIPLDYILNFLSISYSTGKPWQSQPKRRVTW